MLIYQDIVSGLTCLTSFSTKTRFTRACKLSFFVVWDAFSAVLTWPARTWCLKFSRVFFDQSQNNLLKWNSHLAKNTGFENYDLKKKLRGRFRRSINKESSLHERGCKMFYNQFYAYPDTVMMIFL